MVYVTGDCHADFSRFSTSRFVEGKDLSRDDTVIVCGDFGIWHDDREERHKLDWLQEKPFTIAFVDGNHENFDRLYSDEFQTGEFHGGMAHKIRENIYHLMRGEIFYFDGKAFFTFGGASSHDIDDGILDFDDFNTEAEFIRVYKQWDKQGKSFRVNHLSWWEQELPSNEEMDHGLKTLNDHGNKVDYVITHCCPQEIASINGYFSSDILTNYLDEVALTIQFDKWFFGHYHSERTTLSKYVMLYYSIVRII